MWLTGLALAAAPLDAGPVEVATHATAHPGRAGYHEMLVGTSVTVRPVRAVGLRLDGDLGLLGPRYGRDGSVALFATNEAEPDLAPPGEALDAALFAEPWDSRPVTRTTALLASQVVLTPVRVGLGSRELAFDLGVGAGFVHTADRRRPAKDTWSRVAPDPVRAQWHPSPVASVGARLGLAPRIGAQVQARGLWWKETFESGQQDGFVPVWVTAGLVASVF
ncbi:MAG: hypothetical protein H6737_27965 [Alphaproteobacteria bacterium]|nr:hypothetical protein [Alphaproteobacteria bacterium]